MTMTIGSALQERRRNFFYFIFFIVHTPIMLVVDLLPLYPASLRPTALLTLRRFYIDNFKDQFFVHPPLWFNGYLCIEACMLVPGSVWAIWGFWKDLPSTPLTVLLVSTLMSLTTLTCVLEMISWDNVTFTEKMRLLACYMPILLVALGMSVDMYLRVKRQVIYAAQKQKEI